MCKTLCGCCFLRVYKQWKEALPAPQPLSSKVVTSLPPLLRPLLRVFSVPLEPVSPARRSTRWSSRTFTRCSSTLPFPSCASTTRTSSCGQTTRTNTCARATVSRHKSGVLASDVACNCGPPTPPRMNQSTRQSTPVHTFMGAITSHKALSFGCLLCGTQTGSKCCGVQCIAVVTCADSSGSDTAFCLASGQCPSLLSIFGEAHSSVQMSLLEETVDSCREYHFWQMAVS